MERTRISKILLVLFAVVLCFGGATVAGPVGTAFTYQSRLIDANNAADGLYDFQFKLFDASTDGNQLGLDVNIAEVDVVDGYFTVELDFNDVNAFNGDARWLDIGVRPGDQNDPNVYTALSPRQKVTPTPHAIYAKTAQSVAGGVEWSGILNIPAGFADGNDDIGVMTESDPTVLESVKDGVSWSEVSGIPGGFADGIDNVGLTAETDPVFSGSSAYGITSGNITNWNTAYGWGNHALGGYLMSETDPTVLASVKDGVSWSELSGIPAGFADGNDDTGDSDWTVSGSNMYSSVAGNVGIGTTSPTAKLQVIGNIRTDNIYEVPFGDGAWTAKESNRAWNSVAMSDDGTLQTAVDYGYYYGGKIYVSTDSGETWTAKESNRQWISVAMSGNGAKQTAVDYYGTGSGGLIYVSTDYGNTWTAKESNRQWISVAMSADGNIQTGVVQGGQIYVSTDSGNTWTPKDSNRWWAAVAMSADGTKQTALGGGIYISRDSGNTWTAKEPGPSWFSVAISHDGMIQTAVISGGQIYVSSPGNVGIGTTSPTAKLEVNGNIKTAGIYESPDGNIGIGTTNPTAVLDVNGDAKVGGKQVAVGEETLRIIRGTILADGSIHAGSGFTVTKVATGFYHINFSTAFSARPSVVATWKYPNSGDDFGSTGTSSNVYTICAIAVDTVHCRIKTQGTSGGAVDTSFEFTAVGPR